MFPAALRFPAVGALFLLTAVGLASCATAAPATTTTPASAANSSAAANATAPASSAATSSNSVSLPRIAPARPTPLPQPPPAKPLAVTRIGGVEFVSTADIAARLSLKFAWLEPARRAVMYDKFVRLEIASDSREVAVDGLRVFLGNAVAARGGQLYLSRIDYERALLPLLRPEFVPGVPPPPKIIAIDPGHGGKDDGMENLRLGLKEKVLALDVALRLKKLLEAAGYKVVMTRTDDRTFSPEKKIDLPLRARLANRAGADLLVSIHFNSLYPDKKTNGTEIYTYTPQRQRSTTSWSFGEADDTRSDAAPVNRYDAWSSLLAHAMHREVLGRLKTDDRGQKTKHLLVLQDLNCPAVLVESLFLSNDLEARLAATPAYRQQIADSIAAGVRSYVTVLENVRPKPAK